MYQPGSSGEYIHELFEAIEETYCHRCVFRKGYDPSLGGPMCEEIETKVILEKPVEEFDDDDKNIWCNKFREGDPTPPQTEGQIPLWI